MTISWTYFTVPFRRILLIVVCAGLVTVVVYKCYLDQILLSWRYDDKSKSLLFQSFQSLLSHHAQNSDKFHNKSENATLYEALNSHELPPGYIPTSIKPRMYDNDTLKEPVNPHPFQFILNHPDVCEKNGQNLTLLIVVISSTTHIGARNAIRDTWGGYARRRGAKLLFFLGLPSKKAKRKNSLAAENNIYHDIIQSDFTDTYKNLSRKSISIMKWISEFCPNVKFALKTDDDMFINVDYLLDIVKSLNVTKTMFGRLAKKWHPHRSPNTKWYIPESMFAGDTYPNFVTGPAYLFTGDSAPLLYTTSLHTRYMFLEDVFITGIVAEAAGIRRVKQPGMLNSNQKFTPCIYERIISSHKHPPSDMRKKWEIVRNQSFVCLADEMDTDYDYKN